MEMNLHSNDRYTAAVLPANLRQVQRDYFGAHTYEHADMSRGRFFPINWTDKGGNTSSGACNV